MNFIQTFPVVGAEWNWYVLVLKIRLVMPCPEASRRLNALRYSLLVGLRIKLGLSRSVLEEPGRCWPVD